MSEIRYEFFTPHQRGFDLVWDFLCSQPGVYSDGILSAKCSYGYERSRDLRVFAGEQQIGHHRELWERFAALEPVFQQFWRTLEQAATDWQREQAELKAENAAECKRRDDALCEQVLAAATQRKS